MSSLTYSIVEVVVRFKRDHVSYLYLSYVFMMVYENCKMCFRPSLLKGVNLIVNAIEQDHRKYFYEEEKIENVESSHISYDSIYIK